MTKADILTILKIDLEIASAMTSRDALLNNLIDLAVSAITKEGITLSSLYTTEEGTLVEMYAAFLYRKRKENTVSMPRSLRYLLNNMLLSQKAKEESNG